METEDEEADRLTAMPGYKEPSQEELLERERFLCRLEEETRAFGKMKEMWQAPMGEFSDKSDSGEAFESEDEEQFDSEAKDAASASAGASAPAMKKKKSVGGGGKQGVNFKHPFRAADWWFSNQSFYEASMKVVKTVEDEGALDGLGTGKPTKAGRETIKVLQEATEQYMTQWHQDFSSLPKDAQRRRVLEWEAAYKGVNKYDAYLIEEKDVYLYRHHQRILYRLRNDMTKELKNFTSETVWLAFIESQCRGILRGGMRDLICTKHVDTEDTIEYDAYPHTYDELCKIGQSQNVQSFYNRKVESLPLPDGELSSGLFSYLFTGQIDGVQARAPWACRPYLTVREKVSPYFADDEHEGTNVAYNLGTESRSKKRQLAKKAFELTSLVVPKPSASSSSGVRTSSGAAASSSSSGAAASHSKSATTSAKRPATATTTSATSSSMSMPMVTKTDGPKKKVAKARGQEFLR
ncbi:unnamed protein product [Amoebophrya sp. A25]|nr:unnamed protein product [Amoebophrya sp. A25]|eukprot:GSA25T00000435001.1